MLAERVVRDWYRGAAWLRLLLPLAWLFKCIVRQRRRNYLRQRHTLWRPPVPVIVVGNITLGGTGKSPLVCALVNYLQQQGWQPGVISRGYGGQAASYPLLVSVETAPKQAGDEPVMLAHQVNCPIVVDPIRVRAAQYLLEQGACDVIISDDGLQHYKLWRDYEVVVLDGARGVGNGWCLPAGPLREPVSRLRTVDAVITNGVLRTKVPLTPEFDCVEAAGIGGTPRAHWLMQLEPVAVLNLLTSAAHEPAEFAGQTVHAVAGIGNPERFFATLRSLGLTVIPHAFADHHQYNPQDLEFDDSLPVLMTEKDAVKCRAFASQSMFALQVRASLAPEFLSQLNQTLHSVKQEKLSHG